MHFILHACLWRLTRFVSWVFKWCLLHDSLCLILTHLLWKCDSLCQICKQSESITLYSMYWQVKLLTRFAWAEVQGFSKGNIMAYNICGSQWETLTYKQINCTWLALAETTLTCKFATRNANAPKFNRLYLRHFQTDSLLVFTRIIWCSRATKLAITGSAPHFRSNFEILNLNP